MQGKPTCDPVRSPAELAEQHESDVLLHLLDEYPAVFSIEELLSELAPSGSSTASQREGVETAIRDLAVSGLLHQLHSYVWPSRSAKAALILTAPGLSRVV